MLFSKKKTKALYLVILIEVVGLYAIKTDLVMRQIVAAWINSESHDVRGCKYNLYLLVSYSVLMLICKLWML